MSNDKDYVKFYCNECNAEIPTNYTNKDLYNNEFIDFTCSQCGHSEKVCTKKLIDKINREALEQTKKYFKIK